MCTNVLRLSRSFSITFPFKNLGEIYEPLNKLTVNRSITMPVLPVFVRREKTGTSANHTGVIAAGTIIGAVAFLLLTV